MPPDDGRSSQTGRATAPRHGEPWRDSRAVARRRPDSDQTFLGVVTVVTWPRAPWGRRRRRVPARKACCASSSLPQKPKATSSVSVAVGTLSAKGMSERVGLDAVEGGGRGAQGAQGPGLAGLDGLEDAVLDLLGHFDCSHGQQPFIRELGMVSVCVLYQAPGPHAHVRLQPLRPPNRPTRPAPATAPAAALSRTGPAAPSCRTCPPTYGGRRRSPRCARAAATWRSPRPTGGPGPPRP